MTKARHHLTSWPRTVALVGNGPDSQGFGKQIDGHDCVVRLNRADFFGAAGTRTDVLTINNWGDPAFSMTRGTRPINELALAAAQMVWLPVPPEEMIGASSEYNFNLPWPAFADLTGEILETLVGSRPYRRFPSTIWRGLRAELGALGAKEGKVPSTGAQTLSYIVRAWPKAKVSLFGFSHEGWAGHPWDLEATWIKGLSNVIYGNSISS